MTEAQRPGARPDEDAVRTLSALDSACLFLERSNQPMHLGCVVEIEGRLRLEELIEILSARLLPMRRFRQRPARSFLDLSAPIWEDDPEFDLFRHVRHVALPVPGDEVQLRHVVETLFSAPLPPDRPLWEIHLIDGVEGGGSALLCKLHHCMSDGLGALQVLQRIADPPHIAPRLATRHAAWQSAAARSPAMSEEEDAVDGAEDVVEAALADGLPEIAGDAPEAGGRAARGLIETVVSRLGALASPARILSGIRELGEAAAVVESLIAPRPEPPFVGRLGHTRRMAWRVLPMEEIASLRAAADCTVNDAILAIAAGALRRHLADRGHDPDAFDLRAAVPVSVRGADDATTNLFTAVFPRIPVHLGDPLERLRHVRDEMREIKRRGQARATGHLLALYASLPWALESALLQLVPDHRLVDTVCTNLCGPADPATLGGHRIGALHPIVPLFQRIGLGFAVASYAGRLSICVSADPSLVPAPEEVLRGFEESLYETRTALWARSDVLAIAAGIAQRLAPGSRAPAKPVAATADAAPQVHWNVQPSEARPGQIRPRDTLAAESLSTAAERDRYG